MERGSWSRRCCFQANLRRASEFHRSADVTNQDDRARGFAALPPGEIDEITAAHQIASQHRPQVDVAVVGALPPPRSAHAQFPRELFQERRQLTGTWTEQQDNHLRIVTANQTTKVVEHDLRTGTDRDLYAYEPRPDRDVAAITDDRVIRLVAADSNCGATPGCIPEATVLVSSPIGGGETKELMRARRPEVLSLLDWAPDRTYGLFAKTIPAQGQTELWRVPLNGADPMKVATVPDLSSFVGVGWMNRDTLHLTRNAQGMGNELWRLTTAGELTKIQAIQPATAYRLRPSPTHTDIAYLVPDTAAERPLEVWVLENVRPSANAIR